MEISAIGQLDLSAQVPAYTTTLQQSSGDSAPGPSAADRDTVVISDKARQLAAQMSGSASEE